MKPRLLDMFCGAGGCSVGYARAGFEVVGVDIEPQPNYPFDLVRDDALCALERLISGAPLHGTECEGVWWLREFDAIHASPPCQSYSRALRHLAAPKPRLLDEVRGLLEQTGLPWVIENVMGAPMPEQDTLDGRRGVVVCGTGLGLRVERHRLFETNFPVSAPPCNHRRLAMNPHNQAGRDRIYEEFGRQDPEVVWRREMGVEWMNKQEGRNAIPPAYTEHIGSYLLAHLNATAQAA